MRARGWRGNGHEVLGAKSRGFEVVVMVASTSVRRLHALKAKSALDKARALNMNEMSEKMHILRKLLPVVEQEASGRCI